jgi:hypothetical protein
MEIELDACIDQVWLWTSVIISKKYRRDRIRGVMSTHFYSCRHLLGLQVQRFVEQQQVSLK